MAIFPRGRSGYGLMLLRITAACLLAAIACGNLSHGEASALSVSIIVLAIFLSVGFFTIAASSLAAVLTITVCILLPDRALTVCAASVSVCAALALLGAGAYSIDARLFGQRRVVWPHH